MRYSELSRLIAGVGKKMQTQILRSLERDGPITREVVPTVPVTTSYSLTELDASLYQATRHIRGWAHNHLGDVQGNRKAYDAAVE
ncbi:winged helix-turn-helix transcriptional regulator [Demequina aurantiaca]|uniref:winged helix-turn-helix transcriptional regulator n=1 Tax=Demequina aurantiaca TaxID=676200 RepID=UPI0007819B5A|nr:helix-turn-helix domain-containing protein [Demequina aurantiaca]